jgi:hypothetical protein
MKSIIIQSFLSSDRNIINNNPIYKSSFENIYNQWNEYLIQTEGKIRIRLPSLIEKYKGTLEVIDAKYFSKTVIYFTSDEIFDIFNNNIFSVVIDDNNEIKAMAIGHTWPDCYYISHVRSNLPGGGCNKVISKLLDFYWDNNELEFTQINDIKNPLIKLHVRRDNIPAIKCYCKFGFDFTNEKMYNDDYLMILTKESYVKNYLLPLYNERLIQRLG